MSEFEKFRLIVVRAIEAYLYSKRLLPCVVTLRHCFYRLQHDYLDPGHVAVYDPESAPLVDSRVCRNDILRRLPRAESSAASARIAEYLRPARDHSSRCLHVPPPHRPAAEADGVHIQL